jgi:hypothetical protein
VEAGADLHRRGFGCSVLAYAVLGGSAAIVRFLQERPLRQPLAAFGIFCLLCSKKNKTHKKNVKTKTMEGGSAEAKVEQKEGQPGWDEYALLHARRPSGDEDVQHRIRIKQVPGSGTTGGIVWNAAKVLLQVLPPRCNINPTFLFIIYLFCSYLLFL